MYIIYRVSPRSSIIKHRELRRSSPLRQLAASFWLYQRRATAHHVPSLRPTASPARSTTSGRTTRRSPYDDGRHAARLYCLSRVMQLFSPAALFQRWQAATTARCGISTGEAFVAKAALLHRFESSRQVADESGIGS